MCKEIRNWFDLNGDGKLDGIETAFAYYLIFGDDEEQESDILDSDCDEDD